MNNPKFPRTRPACRLLATLLLGSALLLPLGAVAQGRQHLAPDQASQDQSVVALPRATPESVGIDSAGLARLLEAFDARIDSLHSLMILRHGKVVAEGWWAPYSAEQHHTLWSLTKSFSSTAVGLAVAEGRLSLDAPVISYFPEDAPADASEHLRNLHVRDLLRMTTGQTAKDTGAYNHAGANRAAARFFALPLPDKPGTSWHYNNAASHMLSVLVQKVTGQKTRDYLAPRLFEPLGIGAPTWESNPEGHSFGAFGLHLRTEDIARFGQLLLQRGEWNGRRLLPAAWVDEATARQTSNGSHPDSDWDQGYGYQFWRCTHGFYRADGAFGQFCIVMPEHDMVVAITAGTADNGGIMKVLWEHLLPELRSVALPENEAALSELRSRLGALTLPQVAGQALNDTGRRVDKRRFKLEANPLQVEALETAFNAEGATLTLHYRNGNTLVSRFAAQGWNRNNALPGPTGTSPMAGNGAWTAEDSYTCKAVLCDQPVVLTTTLNFAGDSLTITQSTNVAFGENKPLVIRGTAD